jgi:hypothetical protein
MTWPRFDIEFFGGAIVGLTVGFIVSLIICSVGG